MLVNSQQDGIMSACQYGCLGWACRLRIGDCGLRIKDKFFKSAFRIPQFIPRPLPQAMLTASNVYVPWEPLP